MPFQVISDLLAMPTERAEELRSWSQALTQGLEPACTEEQLAAADVAARSMGGYVQDVIADRRRHLGDDVLSGLIAVEEEGDALTTDELVATVLLLYVAGHETTVNLIGNGVLALLRHPDQLARWRADPTLDAHAVDELLRFDGPVQLTVRVPLEPVRFDDVEVEAGTPVMAVLGAANHDPAEFDRPDDLDLGRPNASRHLAFGGGIHYCLGASLARAEAQIAIGTLIRRFPHVELAARAGVARPPHDPRRQPPGARRRLTADPVRPRVASLSQSGRPPDANRTFMSALATAECVIRGHERGSGGLGQTGGMGSIRRLLVANRGEVALRILRAAAELDIETVAVHAEDDGDSLAVRRADRGGPAAGDRRRGLPGRRAARRGRRRAGVRRRPSRLRLPRRAGDVRRALP